MRLVLEETGRGHRRVWFFNATPEQMVVVAAAVDHHNQQAQETRAELFFASAFLRVYGCTEQEEELYIGQSMQRDDSLDIVTCTAAQAINALEEGRR